MDSSRSPDCAWNDSTIDGQRPRLYRPKGNVRTTSVKLELELGLGSRWTPLGGGRTQKPRPRLGLGPGRKRGLQVVLCGIRSLVE